MAETSKIFVEIYIKTYARTGPYMIGLGLGYLLHKTRSNKMTMSLVSKILHTYNISEKQPFLDKNVNFFKDTLRNKI